MKEVKSVVLGAVLAWIGLARAGVLQEVCHDCKEGFPVPVAGRTLTLPALAGETLTLSLGARETSTAGVVTYSGRTPEAAYDNATVTLTQEGYVVRVRPVGGANDLVLRVDRGTLVVREEARRKRPRRSLSSVARQAPVVSPMTAMRLASAPDPLVDGAALMRRGEQVTNVIDVLIAVDASSAQWIRTASAFAGTDRPVDYFAADAVARCNQVLANTDLTDYFTFNLAGTHELAVDCSTLRTADGHVDVWRLYDTMTDQTGIFKSEWKRLAEKREACCADLFSLLVASGAEDWEAFEGIAGIGNGLDRSQIGYPEVSDIAANVCLVEAVAEGTTLVHELGHNMGAGHAEMAEKNNSGPQLYDYSAGWYFNVTNAEGVVFMHGTTVMGYNSDGREDEHRAEWGDPPEEVDDFTTWACGLFTETEFFSSARHTFRYRNRAGELVDSGVGLGDAHHDNTRLLAQVYPVIANFRVRKSTLTLVAPCGGAQTLVGTGAYANGAIVTLKATPLPGYAFAGWYRAYDEASGNFDAPVETADGADYRNPVVKVAIPREGTTAGLVYARFLPLAEVGDRIALDQDGAVFTLDGGLPMKPLMLTVTSEVLTKLAVTGLPSGLKYDAKTSTVSGTPTKAGRYTVKAAVSSIVLPQPVVRFFTIEVRDFSLTIQAWDGGTAKGAGRYLAGRKVSLAAKADKGSVFAGWLICGGSCLEDGEPLEDGAVDYRTPTYPFVMPDFDVTLAARFVTVERDAASLAVLTEERYETAVDGTFALDVPVASLSLPKLSLKGLPAGLKFDAKLNRITGRAKKPGVYTVTVSATNASVKKAIAKELTLVVPNFRSAAFTGLAYEAAAYPLSAGVVFDPAFIDLGTAEGWTLTAVAGLPAGLTFNAKTGEITGVATKAGTYTVTLTAKNGRQSEQATVTFTVAALPAWTYGVFDGAVTAPGDGVIGTGSLTISAVGKTSGKLQWEGLAWTVTGAAFDRVETDEETGERCWIARVQLKSGKTVVEKALEITSDGAAAAAGIERGCLRLSIGTASMSALTAVQNLWKTEPWKTTAKAFAGKTLTFANKTAFGSDMITLKTAASGTVTATGRFETGRDAKGKPIFFSATAATVLLPQVDGSFVVFLYFPPKVGKFDGYAARLVLSWQAQSGWWEIVSAE